MERKWFPAATKIVTWFVALFLGVGGTVFLIGGVSISMGRATVRFNERLVESSILTGLPFILVGLLLLTGGIGFVMSLRAGVEVTEDGLTSVNWKGQRQSVYWSQVTAFDDTGISAILKTAGDDVRITKGIQWEDLAQLIRSRLPKDVVTTDERPSGRSLASLTSTIFPYAGRKAMKAILVVGSIAMLVVLAIFLSTNRSSNQFPFLITLIVANTAIFYFVITGVMRTQVEVKSDGFTYTPRFGRAQDVGYSEIKSVRFDTHRDEGTLIEEWIISRTSGKDIRLSHIERVDELIAVLASKMPSTATFVGRNRTDG